jgi:endonuclease-3
MREETLRGETAVKERAGAIPKAKPGSPSRRAGTKAKTTVTSRRKPGFARETLTARRARGAALLLRLHAEYPGAACSLTHRDPYELLVATILSAQCTDERVNQVTPALFRRYPSAPDLAEARTEELEQLIRSTGFFRNKARSLLGMAAAVTARHGGQVPADMAALTALPGVGRKTANVVLGNAFHRDEGVVVDTHVSRLSRRLGLTRSEDPVAIERDLMKLVPREEWTMLAHLFIYHGRATCRAPTPRCEACVLTNLCPSSRV